jgi:predicted MPP superfamily phosphohydrolase
LQLNRKTAALETGEASSLAERLQPRIAVEQEFARLGHSSRHGPLYRVFEHRVIRPSIKTMLYCAGLYARGVRNALRPIVREVPLHFPNLPPAFDGFRILQISDLHIDGTDGLAEALACVLEGVSCDVCVLTGDYRFEDFGPCDEVYPRMRTVLSSVSATHGIYGILGNHDTADLAFGLEEMGVRMLVNDAAEIPCAARPSLWLIGVDDPFDFRCHDLRAALSEVPQNAFKILLAHAPELYDEAAENGIDLYLSGHTHAGQIRFPIIGSIRQNANCPRPYASGHWRHRGMQGYTTAGAGCSSLPVRFNCPPEVVVFELRSALTEP